jgi:hypothetical protein
MSIVPGSTPVAGWPTRCRRAPAAGRRPEQARGWPRTLEAANGLRRELLASALDQARAAEAQDSAGDRRRRRVAGGHHRARRRPAGRGARPAGGRLQHTRDPWRGSARSPTASTSPPPSPAWPTCSSVSAAMPQPPAATCPRRLRRVPAPDVRSRHGACPVEPELLLDLVVVPTARRRLRPAARAARSSRPARATPRHWSASAGYRSLRASARRGGHTQLVLRKGARCSTASASGATTCRRAARRRPGGHRGAPGQPHFRRLRVAPARGSRPGPAGHPATPHDRRDVGDCLGAGYLDRSSADSRGQRACASGSTRPCATSGRLHVRRQRRRALRPAAARGGAPTPRRSRPTWPSSRPSAAPGWRPRAAARQLPPTCRSSPTPSAATSARPPLRQAVALFDTLGADAVTANPYLGPRRDRATSSSAPIASCTCCAAPPTRARRRCRTCRRWRAALPAHVARRSPQWAGTAPRVGLVVGATAPAELAVIRRPRPDALPGAGRGRAGRRRGSRRSPRPGRRAGSRRSRSAWRCWSTCRAVSPAPR